jgi:hypothetical protein
MFHLQIFQNGSFKAFLTLSEKLSSAGFFPHPSNLVNLSMVSLLFLVPVLLSLSVCSMS